MADRSFPIIDEELRVHNPDLAFTRDFISATDPDVIEFYGPKFQLYYTDREVRIAFGTSYNTYDPDDGRFTGHKFRYKSAVFMPLKTARELLSNLNDAIKNIERNEYFQDRAIQGDKDQDLNGREGEVESTLESEIDVK